MRTTLLTLLTLVALLAAPLARADDCTEVGVRRNNQGFTVKRILLADSKTTVTTSEKCVLPSHGGTGGATAAPWDFYRIVADEGDTCAGWSASVRDYPVNTDTTQCEGTCDSHVLATFDKTAVTSKTFHEPLGEAQDVDVTAIDCEGGLSVYIDLYHRNYSR